jgi:V8-like Glu-specific endopeptidase
VIEGYSCVRTDLADRLCVYRLAHYPERGNSGAPVYSEAGCLIGIIVAGDFERGLTYFSPTLFLSSP